MAGTPVARDLVRLGARDVAVAGAHV
jgi:hypothetical protein